MSFPTKALVRWALILTALWLAGCTTYVQTQVTAFSDWSGNDTTRTYAFARKGEQQNSIEQTTYETLVANELSKYNFRQVAEASANYQVAIAYSVRGDTMTVRQPVYYDPWPMYGGPWGGPFWGGPWGGWGPYGPWGPTGYVDQSYPVYIHALQIRMNDRKTGREAYKVTAVNSTGDPSLYQAMPYLVRSALADFPLGNGTVRTVTLPVDKNGGVSNETASSTNANERSAAPAPAAKAVD